MSRNNGRNTDGRFAPGNPGRPKGSRNKTTAAISALLDGEAEAITRKAVEMALEGDSVALRLCLEKQGYSFCSAVCERGGEKWIKRTPAAMVRFLVSDTNDNRPVSEINAM